MIFVDMSGPGAVTPFAQTMNLCIPMKASHLAYADDWNRIIQSAMLSVNDRLAQTTVGLEPPELQTYDLGMQSVHPHPALPPQGGGDRTRPSRQALYRTLLPFPVEGEGISAVRG